MKYELKSLNRIGPQLREVFDREVAEAISRLTGLNADTAMEGTHEARKHFKKIRALLRLMREGLGKETQAKENACFRHLGRELCQLRDAQMQVKTLDGLQEDALKDVSSEMLTHGRKLLMGDERRSLRRLMESKTLAGVVATLRAARERAAAWELDAFGWPETFRALRRSYRRARAAAREASADPDVTKLHECRKRVKDLWYHTRLLHKVSPGFMEQLALELEGLTELLGEDHDLAVLREKLVAREQVLGEPKAMSALLELIDLERAELVAVALETAKRLLRPSTSQFMDQITELRDEHRHAKKKRRKLSLLVGDTVRKTEPGLQPRVKAKVKGATPSRI